MGDMADYYLEQMWSQDTENDDWPEPQPPKGITCRCCGVGNLEWDIDIDDHDKYKLYTRDGLLHACKVKPLPAPPKPRVITDPVEMAFRAGHDAGYKAAMAEAFPDVGPGIPTTEDDAWTDYSEPL